MSELTRSDGVSDVTLSDGELAATFVPEVNLVCSSLRHRGEELLGQRSGLAAYRERGSTFGIPLLYPWANRLAAWDYELAGRRVELAGSDLVRADPDTGLPIHGIRPAALAWEVVDQQPDRLEAVLNFDTEPLLSVFPVPHRARYRAAVRDQTLSVRITVEGDEVPVSLGLHPYFELPGVERADLLLALPVRRRDVLGADGIPTGETDAVAPHELDGPIAGRTFDAACPELEPEPRFAIEAPDRRIELRYGPGFPVAQLYVPPDKPFLAIEPMSAPVNALRSGEGLQWARSTRPFEAEFSISVA
jgi:aldose 1-epimerase